MRFIRVLSLLAVFFLSMMFFVQNHEAFSQSVALQANFFLWSWMSLPLPFYFLLLAGFVCGGLFALVYFFTERLRLAKLVRDMRKERDRLAEEVASLRNLPLNERPLSSPVDGRRD